MKNMFSDMILTFKFIMKENGSRKEKSEAEVIEVVIDANLEIL